MTKTLKSFEFAAKGISAAFREQTNLKVQSLIAAMVVMAGLSLRISSTEWGMLAFCCGLVLSMEMMNTAIEHLVNLISPQRHPLAGKIKDIAAGSVLVAAVFAVLTGLFIFGPYLAALTGA